MNLETLKKLREELRKLELEMSWCLKDGAECCGITLVQCNTLFEVGRKDEISIVELAPVLGVDTSTLSRTINGMVNIGLVNRVLNPSDRRYVSLSLTEQGRKLYNYIDTLYNQYLFKIFEYIPEEKQQQVVEALFVLTDAVKQAKSALICCDNDQNTNKES